MVYFTQYEVRQMRHTTSIKEYTQSYWNINDILLYIAYYIYFILSFTTSGDDTASLNTIKVLQCFITLLLFVKFNFYLRIIEKLSFLVVMITTAFKDLWSFFVYFSFFILIFAVFQAILISES